MPQKASEVGGPSKLVSLDHTSRPIEFFNLMMTPEFREEHMTKFTNMRAAMEGAGSEQGTSNYPNFSLLHQKKLMHLLACSLLMDFTLLRKLILFLKHRVKTGFLVMMPYMICFHVGLIGSDSFDDFFASMIPG